MIAAKVTIESGLITLTLHPAIVAGLIRLLEAQLAALGNEPQNDDDVALCAILAALLRSTAEVSL